MFKLCEYQNLTIARFKEFGALLEENKDDEKRILLPSREVPEEAKIGDTIKIFIYLDSKDRMIATTKEPLITLDQVKTLTVTDVTKIGLFLDWGLPKDLLLPFHEINGKPEKGDEVLVRLYIDKSGRPAATMRHLYHYLRTDSPYKKGDMVEGRIYEFGHDFGTFVAVDDIFSGMIPRHEDTSHLRIGDVINLKVTDVKPDGKLALTTRKEAYQELDEDGAKLMEIIESYAGVLPFTEKASPEVIKRETGLSKAAFKRAIGHLYKERKITLDGGKIRKA
ncbi:MAG: S1-like domain-containing RNA-binding protein [Lachnospiraceae bacterium]|nr:S1-like domain-containing RNA-binding protein [Lachnospiraceae bacterium]MDD7664083.1 S1-like domain-containing RNA-binding protein [Lachnospiraceae bacterium]MDY4165305.1 S1-like domain-containing RNA-binding protein [Lachnospiraceae bacterium]